MAWVVDTCLIIDVLDADPTHGTDSARLLDQYSRKGLVVCPVTYVELAPAFEGNRDEEAFFLRQINVRFHEDWTRLDTENAHSAWHRYVESKRQGRSVRRPIADILIGAFAQRFDGLLTRNAGDFRPFFPNQRIRP